MEFLKKVKEIRNLLLILAGGTIGSLVGSKVVKSILDWTDNSVVEKED